MYRHFGTKDVLLEQLLERYAVRWRGALGDEPDYGAALDRLLGATFETGPYLRLLAWMLLNGMPERSAESYRRHSTLDQLPPLAAHQTADGAQAAEEERRIRTETAGALALAFGWRFFNPFIRAALHLDQDERAAADIQQAIRSQLHRLTDS